MRKEIKIAGAGISGLTCAINLAKAGYKVKVFEKSLCDSEKETALMLPNWFSKGDVIEELEKCNIKINWIRKIKVVEIYLNHQKIIVKTNNIPIGYTVLRGGKNSLESYLREQAKKLGVEIKRGQEVKIIKNRTSPQVDVLATGQGKLITQGYGEVFKGKFSPEKVKVFLGKNLSSSIGYGYFFPHSPNVATVKVSREVGEKVDLHSSLFQLKKRLKNQIQEDNFLYNFETKRSFAPPKSAKIDNVLLVGEAAGFQDELFRFGLRYAVISGYLAAKSIIEGLDYDELWKDKFQEEFDKIAKVRKIFQDLREKNFPFSKLPKEFQIDIEKIKKLWCSRKINIFLHLSPFIKPFLSKAWILNLFLKIFDVS